MRFWGVAHASQKAKIKQGGSITFTIGTRGPFGEYAELLLISFTGGFLFKPRPTYSLIVSTLGSVDALARALAIDIAPIRVNVVCPGAVDTEVSNILGIVFAAS